MQKLIVLIFCYVFCKFGQGIKRPPYIGACYRNDPNINKCAEDYARIAIPELTKGDPVYKIPNMQPMHIDAIDLPPITNIRLSMRNVTVRGLDTAQPQNFKFNLTSQDLLFEVFIQTFEITGNYNLTGNILILPIEGQGRANITYIDAVYVYPMHYDLISRKNNKYIQIVKHKITFTPKRAYFYFENLFNGNKQLSDQVLQFMDENWNIVNNDFGPLVSDAIDTIVTATANAILGRVPYDDVFLP